MHTVTLPRACVKSFQHLCAGHQFPDGTDSVEHDPHPACKPLAIHPNVAGYDFILAPAKPFARARFIPKSKMPKALTTDRRSETPIGGFAAPNLPTLNGGVLKDGYYCADPAKVAQAAAFSNPNSKVQQALNKILGVRQSHLFKPQFGTSPALRPPSKLDLLLESPEEETYCLPYALSLLRLIYLSHENMYNSVSRHMHDETSYDLVSMVYNAATEPDKETQAGMRATIPRLVERWYVSCNIAPNKTLNDIWVASGLLANRAEARLVIKHLSDTMAHAQVCLTPQFTLSSGTLSIDSVIRIYFTAKSAIPRSPSSLYREPVFQAYVYEETAVITGYRSATQPCTLKLYGPGTIDAVDIKLVPLNGMYALSEAVQAPAPGESPSPKENCRSAVAPPAAIPSSQPDQRQPLIEVQPKAPHPFQEDRFDGRNFWPGLATNTNTSVQNWAVGLDAKAYSELATSQYSRPATKHYQAHPNIRFIANVLELLATQHVYNQCGQVNRITRVAPVYDRVIRFMQTVPKEQRIPETWYRPELEPFDVNYNKKHSHKVEAYGSATLHTAAEPWVCNVGPGDAIITAETLYFPDLVEQLILAAKSGAQVFCINHFYPNQAGTYTIKFDDHVEATAIVERKSPVSTV